MNDHVHHSVLAQILRALEAFRQLLTNSLLNHTWTRKADQRARLRDLHIAQHGVGCSHATGGWIGEHHDVGLAGLAQHLHRNRRARQLHEREDTLLHARRRAHAHVVVGAWNDERIGLDVLVKNELPGFRALDPEVLRRIAAIEEAANLWPDDVGYPVHWGSVISVSSQCNNARTQKHP